MSKIKNAVIDDMNRLRETEYEESGNRHINKEGGDGTSFGKLDSKISIAPDGIVITKNLRHDKV